MVPDFAKFDGMKQLRWDSSSLDSFSRCPRYYKHSYLDNIQLKIESKVEMYWGSCYHECMEMYDRALAPPYDMSRADAVASALEKAATFEAKLNNIADNRCSYVNLKKAIIGWDIAYAEDNLKTAIMPDGTAAVEVYFTLPIPGIPGRSLSGRIDRMAVDENGDLWIIDRKTTKSSLGAFYFRKFNPNAQSYIYIKAMQMLGLKPAGFMIDAVECQVKNVKFAQERFQPAQDCIDEFMGELGDRILQAERYSTAGSFPRNLAACNSFGQFGCPYRPICGTTHVNREKVIAQEYQQKERRST